MSLSPNEKYPGATEADPNYKDGKFKDNNPSTTNNGSPLKSLDRNEQLALQEAVMDAAGFEYSGVVDTPQNSQMFAAYKAALSNGANLLSNHNFLTPSPDDSQPAPSATPTSYPPGYQIFSNVFANETTGISNLTYVDGHVSFSGGDFYMPVANSGAIERLTDFVASVADFDGKPRTRGVSFALVGDEYRVTVGIDALEDVATNPTQLGSVKFEQGSVATGHEVGSLSVGNLADYTQLLYKSKDGLSSSIPIAANIGDTIVIEDRAMATFKIKSGGVANGLDILDAGNGNTAELQAHKVVDISNFGVDVSGTTSQLSTLQAIFEYARVRNLEVTGTGEVLISGTGDIDIYTNCDFTQIKWIVDSWDGRFRVQRTKPSVVYGAGTPELAELVNSTNPEKGGRVFDGVTSGSNLENAYCIINTSQPFFWYRGAIRNRQIFTRFYNNGVTSNERLYDLDTSLITSVEVMPIEDSFLYIKGFNFSRIDEGNQGLLTVHRNLTIVDGIVVSHDGVGLTEYDGQIGISKTYGSVLRAANSTITEKLGVYSLFFGESCDCIIENFKSDGEGWGATGSDSCSDMTFNDCSLSRIDAHAPIFNDLILNNCHIGNDGIIVQAMGDITMRGGSLSRSPGNFMGAISSRPDTGGACDANITLDGVRITGSAPTQSGNDDILFRCQGDPLAPAIAGSPVVQRFFNKITLLNMSITSPYVMFMQRTSGVVIDAPSEIEISGVRYLVENGIMRFDIGGFSTPTINSESGYSTKITIRRTDVDRIQVLNQTNLTHRLLFDMSGCYNSKGSGVSIETIFGGDYLITNTALSAIDTFNGTYPTTPVSFKVSNGVYIPKTALSTFPEVFAMQDPDDASFVNIDMKYKSATQQNGFNSLNKKDALTRVIAF